MPEFYGSDTFAIIFMDFIMTFAGFSMTYTYCPEQTEPSVNPSNAKATFISSTRMQIFLKTI